MVNVGFGSSSLKIPFAATKLTTYNCAATTRYCMILTLVCVLECVGAGVWVLECMGAGVYGAGVYGAGVCVLECMGAGVYGAGVCVLECMGAGVWVLECMDTGL